MILNLFENNILPSSFQTKKNIRVLFGEGDTPQFKYFINDYNVFTCFPEKMGVNGSKCLEQSKQLVKNTNKNNSILIIIMDMTNKEHTDCFGNLFQDRVTYCSVNTHGIGPDLSCIYKILKKDAEFHPKYFQDKTVFPNKDYFNFFFKKFGKSYRQENLLCNQKPFNLSIKFTDVEDYIEVFKTHINEFLELYPYFNDRMINISIQKINNSPKSLELLVKILNSLHFGFTEMIKSGLTPCLLKDQTNFDFYWIK
jgi:hypothetical protein